MTKLVHFLPYLNQGIVLSLVTSLLQGMSTGGLQPLNMIQPGTQIVLSYLKDEPTVQLNKLTSS